MRTRYELTLLSLSDSHTIRFITFIDRKTKHAVFSAVRAHLESIEKHIGEDWDTFVLQKYGKGFEMRFENCGCIIPWAIRFSGRTQHDIKTTSQALPAI